MSEGVKLNQENLIINNNKKQINRMEEPNPNEAKEKKRNEAKKSKDLISSKPYNLITSRFSNSTWDENRKFISKKQKLGCVYCAPSMMSVKIALDSTLFVLEMNNDINEIMGIGKVKNHPKIRKYSVYMNQNYNRYVFTGKNRIDRADMDDEEEEIMRAFDILCFKGNYHMKRGHGLLAFPPVLLYRIMPVIDLVQFVYNMFDKRNLLTKKQEI
jgi:hypothetical protein